MNPITPLLTVSLFCLCARAEAARNTPVQTRAAAGEPALVEPGKIIKGGDLASNLELLNQWVQPPEPVQRLYAAAYKILAAKPTATFLEVGSHPEIQQICRETGIVHLGGPLLGAVTENGAGSGCAPCSLPRSRCS